MVVKFKTEFKAGDIVNILNYSQMWFNGNRNGLEIKSVYGFDCVVYTKDKKDWFWVGYENLELAKPKTLKIINGVEYC